MPREALLALTAELNALLPFERHLHGERAEAATASPTCSTACAARLPDGPFLYPEDQAADLPLRLLAAEVTREQVFLQLHQELPYEAAVETEKWEERKDGSVRIEQIIHVQRDGQRAIVLGKGGARIKQIGARARHELSQMLERPVHLFLHVKVSERWADDRSHYRTIGLDYDPSHNSFRVMASGRRASRSLMIKRIHMRDERAGPFDFAQGRRSRSEDHEKKPARWCGEGGEFKPARDRWRAGRRPRRRDG